MGLDRVQSEDEIKASALKKWQGFLKQHVMQNLERVSYWVGAYKYSETFVVVVCFSIQ